MADSRHAKAILAILHPDGEGAKAPEEADGAGALSSAASDLLQAVEAKDVEGIESALRSAFEILDAEPHEEGPHEGEDQ